MQTHKRLIARILSFILTSAMVITTLPLNVLANEEVIESTETIQEEGSNGSGEVSENTDGSEVNNEETAILGLEKAGTGTNQVDNDHDISQGEFKLEATDNCCSEIDPHVVTGTTTKYRIYVEKGTHYIELNGVDITGDGSTAIGIAKDATVYLILKDGTNNILEAMGGATMNGAGIDVPYRAKLVISGDGKLESIGIGKGAGIGCDSSDSHNQEVGTITIDGGTIIATGGSDGGAGIGGGYFGDGGTININNGSVTATGGNGAAGIGGGYWRDGGIITIEGGNITATGGSNGAGIGGGDSGTGGTININNGSVTANGGNEAAGIGGGNGGAGGTITISNSANVTANGGSNGGETSGAAGIGGGLYGDGGTITIDGGEVEANGGSYGAGIGGGNEGAGGTININNGTVIATGGSNSAGIGGGYFGLGGTITISNSANVTATGGSNGAGIGGGNERAGGTIALNGGTVIAKGGYGAAGIGGGNSGEGGTITIDGGEVTAKGGDSGAGIGGGNERAAGTITIDGGKVEAKGGAFGAGIGGGIRGAGGKININNGKVEANGGKSAAGIGGGQDGESGIITIAGGTVTATGGRSLAGIGGYSDSDNQTINIFGGTIIAIGGSSAPGIGCEYGINYERKGTINISNSANVTAVSSYAGRAIYAENIKITSGPIMQFDFDDKVDSNTNIEVKDTNGTSLTPSVSYSPTIDFKSIALTVPNIENYTAYAGTDKLKHTVSSTPSDNFNVGAGLNNYTIFKEVTNTLVSIAVKAQPNKTTYTVGDSFDKAGMVVEAAYSDGNKSTINNYTVNPSGALATTDTKVTISYTEGTITKTVDVKITVNVAGHTHTPSNSWTSDATQHWHACIENDGWKMNMASHTFGEWVIDTPATDTQEGSKHRVCSICLYNESGTIPTLTPTPDTPSTGGSSSNSSNSSNNIGVEGVDTGKNVQVTTSKTPDIVKDVIDDKFIVGTFEIKKATEPVKITIKVDKKKTKDIFVLQSNPETGVLELLTKAEVNKDGKAEFTTDSKEKMTIVTQLYEGFIDTVATIEKPSVTYYVNEDQSFKKGWFLVDSKDWYFADYQTEIIHKGEWVADGQDNKKLANWYCLDEKGVMLASKWIANNENGSKWYYVNENGLFLRDTVIDGYVINEEGYWSK